MSKKQKADIEALKKAHDEYEKKRKEAEQFNKDLFPNGVLSTGVPGFDERFEQAKRNNIEFYNRLKTLPKDELIKIIFNHRFLDVVTKPLVKTGLKWQKSKKQNRSNGKLGGKRVDKEKINRAIQIYNDSPPPKRDCSSYVRLANYLTANSPNHEPFKKDWVGIYLKHLIKK